MEQPVTFLVWTDNSPGVLLRLTSLFTRRKTNIESLTVSATETEGVSRFTIVAKLDPILAATLGRQIERMIEIRRVFVFTDERLAHREVALFRVQLSETQEKGVLSQFTNAKVVQRGPAGILIELTDTEDQVSSLLSHLQNYEVREFVRSGRIAVTVSGDFEADLSSSIHELRPVADEGPDF